MLQKMGEGRYWRYSAMKSLTLHLKHCYLEVESDSLMIYIVNFRTIIRESF